MSIHHMMTKRLYIKYKHCILYFSLSPIWCSHLTNNKLHKRVLVSVIKIKMLNLNDSICYQAKMLNMKKLNKMVNFKKLFDLHVLTFFN